jgi:hypothetical protein
MDEYPYADTDFAHEVEMDETYNDDFPMSLEYDEGDYFDGEAIDFYAESSLFGWE